MPAQISTCFRDRTLCFKDHIVLVINYDFHLPCQLFRCDYTWDFFCDSGFLFCCQPGVLDGDSDVDQRHLMDEVDLGRHHRQ